MTATPWGEAETLGERRLTPGPGRSREEVEHNQRERLMAATVAVVAERGYEATRVADLLETAGVSRNAFYKLYTSKQDCFVATIEALVELTAPAVIGAYDRTDGPWEDKLAAILDALAALVLAQPATARVGWVEVYAAGPEAVAAMERMDGQIESALCRILEDSPERVGMPRDIVRAMVCGMRKIVHTRLREGQEGELPELMPKLLRWMLSYQTPPERLRRPRRVPHGLVPPAAEPFEARDRILAAVTEIVADTSYPDMAITEIARRAAVSLTTFYLCFESKEEAFVAAIDRGRRRSMSVTAPAYESGDDWPHKLATGLHGFAGLMTLEPAIARLGGIAAYEGGPHAQERRDGGITASYAFLFEGRDLYPDTPEVAFEALGASVYALLADQIRRCGAERLYEMAPTGVFLVLAPFLGSEEAGRIANEPIRVPTHTAA